MSSSDIYQVGVTLGISSSGSDQGVPDQPNSLLLYKDKESAKSSWFKGKKNGQSRQLTILAL